MSVDTRPHALEPLGDRRLEGLFQRASLGKLEYHRARVIDASLDPWSIRGGRQGAMLYEFRHGCV